MIENDDSAEYHLKQIIDANTGPWPGQVARLKEFNVEHSEAALESLKAFAIDLAGLMNGLAERLADLEEEIYMLNLMEGEG